MTVWGIHLLLCIISVAIGLLSRTTLSTINVLCLNSIGEKREYRAQYHLQQNLIN
jgi:hypothetical protein